MHVQFRWAAMQFLVATSSFPVALSYVRESVSLRTQLAQCAIHPLISGVDAPLPLTPSPRDPQPGSGPALPTPRPFPADPRTHADLVRGLAHGAYHVLALVHAFSESPREVQAQINASAAALLLEVQARDVAERAPTMVSLLRGPAHAAAGLPQSPATKDAVQTLRRAVRGYVRAVEALYGAPALLIALEALVQVEISTDIEAPTSGLKRTVEGGAEGEARPRRDADDGSRDALPPLTVRDGTGGGVGSMTGMTEMPEEIVQWTMQRLERNGTTAGGEVQMSAADVQELNALMQKYNISDATAPLEAPGDEDGKGSMTLSYKRSRERGTDSVSSRGSMPAGDGMSGSSSSGGKQAPRGFGVGGLGSPPPTAQDAVRVAVAQGGLGYARDGILAGSSPQPAVTLASAGAQKAEITVTMFPGDSGDILLSHFSFTIRSGAQQVRPPFPARLPARR